MHCYFTGSHTGAHISEVFESILNDFGIVGKVTYVITDNASNMRKAFSVQLCEPELSPDTSEVTDIEDDDGDPPFENVPEEDMEAIRAVIQKATHIRCFAHSLQLAVNDGLKDVKPLYGTLGKCSKIATLLHSSTSFKVVSQLIFLILWVIAYKLIQMK